MTIARDFRTAHVQLSLFTPGLQLRPGKVLAFLVADYGEQFDGDPVSLPKFPGDLPVEVPQLILQSADGKLKLQASAARLDVFKGGESFSEEEIAAHLDWATGLGLSYLHRTQAHAARVACVLHRMADDANPARALSSHFCKQRWTDTALNRPGDFELHAHKRFRLDDLFEINSWVRCKTAVRVEEDKEKGKVSAPNLILVEQDFNSLAEQMEERELRQEEIRRFFALAPAEMRHVLGLYFPND